MEAQLESPAAKASPRMAIESLLSLINTAAQRAMTEYETAGSKVPSLDALEPHALDGAHDMAALRQAVTVLEGACRKLITTLAPATHTTRDHLLIPGEQACIRFAVELRIADKLLQHPSGLSSDELAQLIGHGISVTKISRIMKFLVSRGYFVELSPNTFGNNRLSFTLLADSPVVPLLYISTKMFTRGFNYLPEALLDPEFGPSDDVDKVPFAYAIQEKYPKTSFFEWLQKNPVEKEYFAKAMAGLNVLSVAGVKCPIWNNLSSNASICDVGSGTGTVSRHLAQDRPGFTFTLIDRPEVIEQAETLFASQCSETVRQRFNFVPGDFFTGCPPGKDVYYARHIIHDWPDHKAFAILTAIRKAMKPDSRVLLEEYILPDTTYSGSAHGISEETFLRGERRLYHLDILMLCVYGGRERSLKDFNTLTEKVGLQFVKRWPLTETSILEYVVA